MRPLVTVTVADQRGVSYLNSCRHRLRPSVVNVVEPPSPSIVSRLTEIHQNPGVSVQGDRLSASTRMSVIVSQRALC